MTANKLMVFFIYFFSLSAVYSQQRVFRVPRPDREAFRMKVVRNDTIIIAEDSAYIYSIGMTAKIRELEQLYLSCLTLRNDDLQQIRATLVTLQDSYDNVNELISQSSNLNKEQLGEFQEKIKNIVANLDKDVKSLQQVEYDLTNAQNELDNVKKEIKKERSRLWWKKTGSIFIAAVAGFAAGFIIASAG
jgi:hypothetical protein